MANAKRPRGVIGNKNPNQRARITTKTGPKGVRILRALDPMTYKTLQRQAPGSTTEALNNPSITKNQVIQQGKRLLGGPRQGVRRLFRRDPYNLLSASAPPPFNTGATTATFADEADQFTNNPNPSFHPEPGISSPAVKRQPQPVAGRKNRGKTVVPNRFSLFGGKTLRRR